MFDSKFWQDVRAHATGILIATAVLAVGSWLLGWWPRVWQWVRQVAEAAWTAVSYTVRFPASLVVVFVVALIVLARLLYRARAGAPMLIEPPAGEGQAPRRAHPAPRPDELQQRILRLLAELDGETTHPGRIPQDLNVGQLIVDQALRRLERLGLIFRHRAGYGGDPGVGLTEAGRDYAIAAGYARERPRHRW